MPSPALEDTLTLGPPRSASSSSASPTRSSRRARSPASTRARRRRPGARRHGRGQAAAGLTQSLPLGASGSRTAVNDAMGARTQIAGLLAAVSVVIVLLFLTGPIADLPKAVLGAVIVSAAIGLVEPAAWRGLWDTDRVEFTIAAVTAAGVIAVGVLEAIIFAAGLSIIDVVRRSAQPHDAVLGWVERLGRWADVSVHRSARRPGRRRVPARRSPLLRQPELRQGSRTRSDPRRTLLTARSRPRRGRHDTCRQRGTRRTRRPLR